MFAQISTDWPALAERLMDKYGFPTVVAILLLGAVAIAMRWLAKNVFTPVTKGHMEFLRASTQRMGSIDSRLESLAESHQTLAVSHQRLTEHVERLAEGQDKILHGMATLASATKTTAATVKEAVGVVKEKVEVVAIPKDGAS